MAWNAQDRHDLRPVYAEETQPYCPAILVDEQNQLW